MIGYRFTQPNEQNNNKSIFDQLLELFLELLTYTSGSVQEALDWLHEIDREYHITNKEYGMADFIDELIQKGYIANNALNGDKHITAKSERAIRRQALDQIFGKLKKGSQGNHATPHSGLSDESTADRRAFEFGDTTDQIAMTESLRNAQLNHGINHFMLTEADLEVHEKNHQTNTATVLMIDISHSMILYGEDRITPAKKVAMALSELITTKYPKDTLDIIVFGNDAWSIQIKDLPYLQVGPYHTNTVAGLELAMDLLRRKKTPNKQIFMITDGKPTCLKEGNGYYKNSWGLDAKILNRVLNLGAACRRLRIPITTFMIATDPYLQKFVQEFTEVNQGKAFYASLDKLGDFIFEDYERNRRKRVR
jgi:Ca-activated chloride channel family protein